jgi:uncharacterized protein YqjF (DUF2071 family)
MSVLEFLSTPARQAGVLRETEHRPWPVPERPWVQAQTWDDLLFAHWRIREEALRPLVPPELPLDTFDGFAWLGVTPFRLTGFRVRGTLPLPLVSSFLELNVRTYVTLEDKPGIYFFSLDCESPLAVEAARRLYKLPYQWARMSAVRRGEWLDYSSARRDEEPRPFVFEARYRPHGRVTPAQPGSLEYFLTERYCLYTVDDGDVYRADIHHPPWPLRPAEARIERNTMAPDGLELPDDPPLFHFSARQDVVIWALDPVRAVAAGTRPASAATRGRRSARARPG